jgi:hypothetical protein
VLAVGQLLREVIIVLAEDHTLSPDRADLYRIALRRLTPMPACNTTCLRRPILGCVTSPRSWPTIPSTGAPWPN